jgi:hypothetical protein
LLSVAFLQTAKKLFTVTFSAESGAVSQQMATLFAVRGLGLCRLLWQTAK